MAEAHREEIAKLEALYAAHPEGRVFTHLAEAYRRAGELDRAREILEDGLRRHPDYSSAHVVFGRVLMDLNASEAAAGAFRRVLELDRHNLVALRSLGDLAEKAGDRTAAVGYYRDLIALDPTDDRLRIAVARLEEQIAAGAAAQTEEAAAVPDAGAAAAASSVEPAPWEPETAPERTGDTEAGGDEAGTAAAIDFPQIDDSRADEVAEPDDAVTASFPALDEAEPAVEDTFFFEGGTLEVEGLSLGWDAAAEEPVAGRPSDEPDTEPAPDSLAGLGWTAGDTADTEPGEPAPEDDTAPVGDEALVADDDDWASVGDRAEAAWTPPMGSDAGDHIEEITTWGGVEDDEALDEPVSDETAAAESVIYTGPEADADFVFEVERVTEASALEAGGPEVAEDDEPEAAALPPARNAGEVVTATMAELYAQQGFYDRSVDVYRQLLEQVPEDERLRERLAEVELLGRVAAREAAPEDESEESVSEASSVWTGSSGVAGGEETPYAWADSAGDEAAPGVTAGAYFRSLLRWRPGGSAGTAEVLDLTEEQTAPEAGAAAVELEAGAVAAAFEEWFGEKPEDRGEEAVEEQAGEDDADLAMFRSWLQSLKK